MEYTINDLIIGKIILLEPCPIKIVVDDKKVRLWVGPRDWAWDKESGKLTGCGTSLMGDVWKGSGKQNPKTIDEDETKDRKKAS